MVSVAVIESALGELRDPPTPVGRWQVQAGPDTRDDPVVWVWVMLEHDDVGAGTRSRLRGIVREAVRRETGDTSPTVLRRASRLTPMRRVRTCD